MLENAIKSNPRYIESYITLGTLYCMNMNKLGTLQGIELFQIACKIDPNNFEAKTCLARAKENL